MHSINLHGLITERAELRSGFLAKDVVVDFFLPTNVSDPSQLHLLLINDGQNMEEMCFADLFADLLSAGAIDPVFCVAIHADKDRKMDYGIADEPDYLGRGANAQLYTSFIIEELIPHIHKTYKVDSFAGHAFAGFSLGALSALDIAWKHPQLFSKAGLFSGSFWWRSLDQENKKYSDDKHRIMHQVIRKGIYKPGMKFFFQTGCLDETSDRNKNGIIDSIDDTTDLINELVAKGYKKEQDIFYLELVDGRHDIPTWGRAIPEFLKWGWGKTIL